ncbi:Eco57I restriction-modification methylase domain-containing protein [Rhabdothermincola salaria]|uniref:Eco57I restriction-modification methylase domain-containing protein n=1 Tax=Rhabdothermincola salaria TaxID=2903142 RepID=UPI001E3718B1|nr:hypothetical protein [Rhabdothermincola salaria]MCD9624215.1 hypothetical protein [Rhabdothermincola salaria]
MSEFLEDVDPRRWKDLPDGSPAYLKPVEFYLGVDPNKGRDIVVRVVDAERPPARGDLERLWQSMAQTLVLVLAVRYVSKGSEVVDLVGGRRKLPANAPKGARPRPLVVQKVPVVEARKFCQIILSEETPHSANRLVARWMDERATEMPGLKNDGLFARHALLNYVPERPDWPPASEKATKARDTAGRDLVKALGFHIDESSEPNAVLLTIDGAPTASALFLEGAGSFDEPSAQYGAISPVTHALAVARRHRVRWVVLTRKRSIRLHPVSPDLGVGRRGRTTTYVEINLDMLPEDRSAFLWLLFSSEALTDGGTVDEILAASERFANDLGSRLRERVYNEVVPDLATALGRQLAEDTEDGWLTEAYHRTMVVLFRMLFVAYAEDKGLLPYERNIPYTNASLKTIARELIPYVQGEQEFSPDSAVFWRRVVNLWRAVDKGKTDWGIPAYNGGLFSTAGATGAALDKLELSDLDFGPALARLLVDIDPDGVEGPVDFRSLSVREFGSIYEGLLESELAVAETDLTTDKKGLYLPSRKKDKVVVAAGEVYFHNASGARKSSGSYFTKPFAVEHLLDHALEPAIADHFGRVVADLDRGDDAAAARRFFDFRCVDISMGSGHFLVAAVDRLEARFSEFLDEHPIPGVTRELETLREAALNELRHCADDALIENAALLRRQIARRCVYGVDLNLVSVELARLAIWIHTFVPGLPLSFLDHNLVAGNSLTGIGTLDEAAGAVDQNSFVAASLEDMIGKARPALERLGTVTDATVADVKAARSAHEEAKNAIADAERLFDLLVLNRADLAGISLFSTDQDSVAQLHADVAVADALSELNPLHYPTAFPEVFLRERPGFDCILGNPPWDKVRFEPQQFWVVRAPGLRSLSEPQQKRMMERLRSERPAEAMAEVRERESREQLQGLIDNAFLWQGRGQHGHHDYAKLFVERALRLLGQHGSLGYVLPRTSLVLAGWTDLRRAMMDGAELSLLQARNKRGFLFDDVDQRLMMVLCSRTPGSGEVLIWPSITSEESLRNAGATPGISVGRDEIESLTDKSVIPWFSSGEDRPIFDQLRKARRLGEPSGWITGRADSSRWDFSGSGPHRAFITDAGSKASWRVLMTRHVDQYRIAMEDEFRRFIVSPAELAPLHLGVVVDKRGRVHVGADHPVIIYRYPSMNDNSRTVLATALPDEGFLFSKGYVHGVMVDPSTSTSHILALLGLMNSYTCDWWARRFVDRHVTKQTIENLPLPEWDEESIERVARWVAALLSMGGTKTLAGGRKLEGVIRITDRDELVVAIEKEVLLGFGLSTTDLASVLEDFSDTGCPEDLRSQLLEDLA